MRSPQDEGLYSFNFKLETLDHKQMQVKGSLIMNLKVVHDPKEDSHANLENYINNSFIQCI